MVIMMMTVNISNAMRTMMLIEMRRMDEKKARAFFMYASTNTRGAASQRLSDKMAQPKSSSPELHIVAGLLIWAVLFQYLHEC